MMDDFFDSETFSKIDFSKIKIKKGEYDSCTFSNCNFENVHLSNIQFLECEFIDCNFSNTIVTNTAFKEVSFIKCKMIGVKFNECNLFLLQFRFTDCQLTFSSFYQLKIPKTLFVNCNLEEVDFTEATLTNAKFDTCDLKKAIFEDTILEKSDFKTAFNFSINPENNKLKGAKFSKENVIGLLHKYNIFVEA
ncbi:pentapeptide repeat-containing protein [Tenacibaculum finnmarkense]|uniref:Pentapeptide repeat-containing protein n=1 Tax=Tenacibaculum finnmarkense genomovar finnmarkense TaxID=1458503 RepID=A0AAP1RF80_9FLAO|nr:pentapeptide repeat-containing protein [Tenacibaculum finnmarkense genomovar finnmarkense]MCG8711992.1 pentapeptide repeat-containing protein [Tenacibaculum finnmarkense]MBE7695225.1 pentapeptide repeat-containing protein [Tenacibaculum finnmarkense genomovar finnmarkense]MCG8715164.1 pentapeptide repeat-containing protein [Tenacibaculum finnmarkense]MCG8717981.1 pentapeptide repeat-containing protein [Tenacibaculum finnmarkense]